MKKISQFVLVISLILACTDKQLKHEEIIFNRNDFKKKTSLKSKHVKLEKLLNPTSFNIIKDTILLSLDIKAGENHFIQLYGLKSKKKITNIAFKGRGPNEFLSTRVSYNNAENYFIIHDYIGHKFAKFNIDSILQKKSSYSPIQIKLPSEATTVNQLNEKELVVYNSLYIKNDRFSNNVNEISLVSITKELTKSFSKEKYFPSNINGGYVLISPNKSKIFVTDFHDDKINIYDNKLKLIKSLKGPDLFQIEYRLKNDGHVSFKQDHYYRSYYPSYYNEKHIYLLYVGANGISSEMEALDKSPVELFKLDWEGNLLHHYQLDKFLINISIDSKEEYLYGTTWSSNGNMPQLVKYKLN